MLHLMQALGIDAVVGRRSSSLLVTSFPFLLLKYQVAVRQTFGVLILEQVSKQHLLGHFVTSAQNSYLEILHVFSERDFVDWLFPTHLMKKQFVGLFLVHF